MLPASLLDSPVLSFSKCMKFMHCDTEGHWRSVHYKKHLYFSLKKWSAKLWHSVHSKLVTQLIGQLILQHCHWHIQ
jgi:hypothetical protein